jgi:hypothetical protein
MLDDDQVYHGATLPHSWHGDVIGGRAINETVNGIKLGYWFNFPTDLYYDFDELVWVVNEGLLDEM